ncbi:outer membrane lipoprotein [Salmonella enterica subsp. enterica serovar Senftenberg str. A4-543]|uniref:Outer membrane lipoprotein n=1 Tax=Salmonella enterica subsp. enterica serovar Senftenberg str. A4-543 TaxID=913082 RepID=G5QWU9_SALSE|nr:outer membrane lipoprotein [Salmonella enterica subsp. enterica serovar Senftenberg str. A4-543]
MITKGIKEMQLNKVLKGLMIALPVMAIAACSSNKNASNDGSEGGMLNGAGTGMDSNGSGNMSSEEQARLQMQQLQQNNIVYFDLDKYDIRSDFAAMLDAHANFLRSNPSYKVTVEGHADERGTPEYRSTTSPWVSVLRSTTSPWVSVVRTLLRCICRVKAFPLTRSPSFLTVKKNLPYWATTKRLTLRTVALYWFTKRIA